MARENASHAPGNEISRSEGMRQRAQMGEGDGPMKGESFGVGPIPGTHIAQNHGAHMPHDGMMMHDDGRANKPNMHMGDGHMTATAHSHHGPHHHDHTVVPEGRRPHHVKM